MSASTQGTASTAEDVLTALRDRQMLGEGGFPMRELFALAKGVRDLPLDEVDRLFAEPAYAARMTAVCVLDFQARRHPDKELMLSYLRNHDRIDDWGMVDRAAPWVIGSVLAGGPYAVLHELAGSPDPILRRTAITAPLWFVKYGSEADIEAGFGVAQRLHADDEPVVHKAVGIWLAHAGDRQCDRLIAFLDEHEAAMARPAVRFARRKLRAG